jgi:origin recognition complex subunit 5
MCHASVSSFLNEIILQLQTFISKKTVNLTNLEENSDEIEMELCDTDENSFKLKTTNDLSEHVRYLKSFISKLSSKSKGTCCIYLIVDNAESLKHFKDSNNLFLMLCKLNEHLNVEKLDSIGAEFSSNQMANVCVLFITEMDWHSLLSDCDVMSRTEAPRPFVVFFNDYTKDQMKQILQKSAKTLVAIQSYTNSDLVNSSTENEHLESVQFYSRTILDVFHPICKDLNEIQYLIQIYYDQVLTTISKSENTIVGRKEQSSYEKMLTVWNSMKPFLRTALTQIYLRNSITQTSNEEFLSKEFESISLKENKTKKVDSESCNQLPKLMKILLISSYIATHNPVKYDKKLFEYGNTKTRKTKFTAQKFQQTEENQRAAALKSQSFELNRLLAIFLAISSESNFCLDMNLNLILTSLKSLKSLQYLQQTNGSYCNIEEPKFKCLLDFDTISQISASVDFNLKQYLAEYLTV